METGTCDTGAIVVGAADGATRTVGSSDIRGLEEGLDVVGTLLGPTDGFCEGLLDVRVGDNDAT